MLILLRAAGYVVQEGPEMREDDTEFYHVNFDVRCWTEVDDGVNV